MAPKNHTTKKQKKCYLDLPTYKSTYMIAFLPSYILDKRGATNAPPLTIIICELVVFQIFFLEENTPDEELCKSDNILR